MFAISFNTVKKAIFWIIGTASLGALLFALGAEHFFDFEPCILCRYERIPYGIALVLCALGLWRPFWGRHVRFLLILTFLGSVGLTFYHILVEQGLLAPPIACTAPFTITDSMTVADLQNLIESQARVVRCDVPALKVFGLSLADYNLIFSLLLLVVCFVGRPRKRRH